MWSRVWEKESSVKKSKFTEAQIAFVLRQVEEGSRIAEAAFYNWRKKFAGLMPSEMKRLKMLDEENGRLKRLDSDLSFDKVML